MCAIDDSEPPTVYREQQPRARKPHRCAECARTIPPGERYHRITGLWDGRWDQIHQCRHCVAVSAWMNTVCGGYLFYNLLEELIEHWDEGYRSVPLARLIVGMKRKWHDGADPVPEGVGDLATQMMRAQVAA